MKLTVLLVALFAPAATGREEQIARQIEQISVSGRVLEIGEARDRLADPRHEIAPGAPPILTFRYFQGADRHRFGNLSVMLDDAGH